MFTPAVMVKVEGRADRTGRDFGYLIFFFLKWSHGVSVIQPVLNVYSDPPASAS